MRSMSLFPRKLEIPLPDEALPGRPDPMPVADRHFVLGTPMQPPFPEGCEIAIFGMGCFWGAEEQFWEADGVYTTAVGYAAGYVANQIEPRLLMTTHMAFDPYQNEETVAQVRYHWKGPYHFGAPDGIVVNVTKESIWVREGILPDYPNSRAPQFDFSNGQLVVPHPPTSREAIQEPFIREMEIDPALYYPEGYMPALLPEWPVEGDLVVPLDQAPDDLKEGMGEAWKLREENRKILEEQKK